MKNDKRGGSAKAGGKGPARTREVDAGAPARGRELDAGRRGGPAIGGPDWRGADAGGGPADAHGENAGGGGTGGQGGNTGRGRAEGSGEDERRAAAGKGLLKLAGLAAALGAGTWLALRVLVPANVPADFPKLPDVRTMSTGVRELLTAADRDARKHPASAAAVGKLGIAYHSNEFFELAAACYRIAARLDPGDSRWPYAQAFLAEERGDEKRQLDLLRQTVALQAGHVPALLKLADRSFKQDKLDEAAHYYEAAAKAADTDGRLQAAFGLARVAARREEWKKAIEYAAPLAEKYPYVRPPFQVLESAYEALGDTQKTAEIQGILGARTFTDVPPAKDAFNEQLLAVCYSSTRLLKEAGLESRFGHPDRGIEVARRAAQAAQADPDPHNFIARTLLTFHADEPEAMDEAVAQLAECLRLKPEDPAPLFGFSNSFFDTPKKPAAVERLHGLLTRYADRGESHYFLGLAAEAQGNTEEAAAEYQAALKNDPDSRRVYNKLGLIFARTGKLDEAIAYFDKAVRLNPRKPGVRLNLAVALMQRGDTKRALGELAEVLRIDPRDAAAHFSMGFGLLQARQPDQAIQRFREGLRYKPDDAEAHFGLGTAFAIEHKRDEAVGELREALRLRPNYRQAQALLQQIAP